MNKMSRCIHLIGYASGLGGVSPACGEGPSQLQSALNWQQSGILDVQFNWDAILKPIGNPSNKAKAIRDLCVILASHTKRLTQQKKFFIVAGGDHTAAIGTWSGVFAGINQPGSLGLIWVDAHMDSHIPETSVSGRFHGMPLAILLGHGSPILTRILSKAPKINPEKLCLIGVRSYEKGEAELLKQLKVRIYFMDEVKKRGLATVFKEAVQLVNQRTVGFGVSVDIDSLDPQEAPGVDVPASGGLSLQALAEALSTVAYDPRLIGAEIVEFNPAKDLQHITEKAVIRLMMAVAGMN